MAFFHFFKKKKASASAANTPPVTTQPVSEKEDAIDGTIKGTIKMAHEQMMKGAIKREDAIKMVFEKIVSEQPPSEPFASGSIFDITRLAHDEFVQLVQSNDAGLLHDFFANAYLSFCHNPQIVGFTPTMVKLQKDDTDVCQWNTSILTLSTGEAVALCYMPIQHDTLAARIVGIVIGKDGDRYYYCMLQKDEDAVSNVMRNKAILGIATIGTVSGRGFELMGRFLDCIEQDS